MARFPFALSCVFFALASCGPGGEDAEVRATGDAPPVETPLVARAAALPECDPDNGGLTLPQGFCALVVAEDVQGEAGSARHLVVSPTGDLFVTVQGKRGAETPSERGGIVALRDTTGDGRMDVREAFGPEGGTGLELRDSLLYFGTNSAVLRYQIGSSLQPASGPDTLVRGLPDEHSHTAKSIALVERHADHASNAG